MTAAELLSQVATRFFSHRICFPKAAPDLQGPFPSRGYDMQLGVGILLGRMASDGQTGGAVRRDLAALRQNERQRHHSQIGNPRSLDGMEQFGTGPAMRTVTRSS